MRNEIVRAITSDGLVQAAAITGRDIVERARTIHTLLPVATAIGIHPVQFGIMIVLNCGIGLLTPPVGAVLFIGSAVAKLPMEKVVKATLPFYICMLIALLLITFVPQISLWLPQLTGILSL